MYKLVNMIFTVKSTLRQRLTNLIIFQAVGGNIMTGSPISDLNPIFLAAGIKLNVCSLNNGNRTVIMDDKFFVGYRRNIVSPDEILLSIEIPFSTPVIQLNKSWLTNIC